MGHDIKYVPPNIQREFFEPKMTSFVQPLDAGIIQCFKVHYHKVFCIQALKMDNAGEEDIYKINLLEVMMLAKAAWAEVTADTIQNCWRKAFQLTQ